MNLTDASAAGVRTGSGRIIAFSADSDEYSIW
jgi:hypothetical protein